MDRVGFEPTLTVLETAVLAVTPTAQCGEHGGVNLSPYVLPQRYISVDVYILSLHWSFSQTISSFSISITMSSIASRISKRSE